MMAGYRRVLRVPGMAPLMLLGMLVKLPVIAIPLVLALQVTLGLDRGMGAAGAVTGVWTLGAAVGSTVLGGAVDRHGVRSVLVSSAIAQGAFWSVAAVAPYAVLVVLAPLSGASLLLGSTVMRLSIRDRVPPADQQAAFALDSMSSHLSYLSGPAVGALLATQVSPAAATRLLGCLLVTAMLALATRVPSPARRQPASVTSSPTPSDTSDTGDGSHGRDGVPWKTLLPVLGCTVAIGIVTSGFEMSLLSVLRAGDDLVWLGLLTALCGGYAVVGGFVVGLAPVRVPPWAATALLGATTAVLTRLTDWRVLTAAVAPAAAMSAVALTCTASTVGRGGSGSRRGRVIGLYGSALGAGNALGAPIVGLATDSAGRSTWAGAGFAAVGGLAVAVGLLSGSAELAGRRRSTRVDACPRSTLPSFPPS
ncbi:MAG TPA: MFS transporter [Kineosporiaceae bacterium]